MLRELFWCNYYDAQLRCSGNTVVSKVSDYGYGSPVVWGGHGGVGRGPVGVRRLLHGRDAGRREAS